jgi:hypothetical protein
MAVTVDLTADIIDIRDIIERIEELPDLIEGEGCEEQCNSYREELATMIGIMAELAGNGGDEQWRGDWYPLTLIRESYFEDYAQELAEDIGAVNRDATWPNNCIDWEQAARELRMDYTSTQIDGVTYFYR